MRVTLLAVGRLRGGPEADLVSDYLKRYDQTARRLGFGASHVVEVEAKKGGGQAAESALILGAVPDGAALVALDERGKAMTSPDFADLLARWRDQGRREAVFAIGGADGHDRTVRDRADLMLSFGPMVWPHMLARVMLAEQLYRAASILSGAPYHRG